MARAATTSDAFNAVAEPRRRDILNYLALQERPVGEIVDSLGLLQPSVSKHLRVLLEVGLVNVRRDGRRMLYRTNADAILLRTNVDMPPPPYGGPWPAEWVALFQRWKDEGFLRLDLGAVDANGYKANRLGDSVTVTGRGTVPTTGYRAWLDATVAEGQRREYVHYWEPPVPAAPTAPTLFRVKAVFSAPVTVTDITIVDANGRQVVPITTPVTPTVLVTAPMSEVQGVLQGLGATHVATRQWSMARTPDFARGRGISRYFLTTWA
jgi:DNA-binding transcriptional ArsR family regulator